MKVIDVLKHKDFQLNSNLINQSSIRVSEDEIDAKLTVALDINEEIDCNYYQYDHMYRTINPRVLGTITLSITTHDWNTFKLYYYNDIKTPCTLPDSFAIFTKDTDILLGYMDLNEETFQYITFNEYECG